jgi:hypothetical protein
MMKWECWQFTSPPELRGDTRKQQVLGEVDLAAVAFGGSAIEEAYAELLLKGADLLADGGLREVEDLGGLAEAHLLSYFAEDAETKVFERVHRCSFGK